MPAAEPLQRGTGETGELFFLLCLKTHMYRQPLDVFFYIVPGVKSNTVLWQAWTRDLHPVADSFNASVNASEALSYIYIYVYTHKHLSLSHSKSMRTKTSRALSSRDQQTLFDSRLCAGRPAAIQPFSHSAIHPFIHSSIQPFNHSTIHPFTHTPTLLTHCHQTLLQSSAPVWPLASTGQGPYAQKQPTKSLGRQRP